MTDQAVTERTAVYDFTPADTRPARGKKRKKKDKA